MWKWKGIQGQGETFALIQNMMYPQRVQAKTQFKSESLKPGENTIKGKLRKVARNMLLVRQQIREVGMEFRIRGF